ncbi:MAG: universal stress protein, partial [Bacteroidia bacterium]
VNIMDYKFKKILIGFDNSAAAVIALNKALHTCKIFKTSLYVINVKDPKSAESGYGINIQQEADKFGVPIQYMEKRGHVSREIHATEKEIKADLIFMGAHGLNGFQPYWIGSNAIRVVSASTCPVITVQADAAETDFTNIVLPLDNSVETRQKVPYAAVFAKAFGATIHVLSVSKDKSAETHNRIQIYGKQTMTYLEEREIKCTFDLKQGKSVAQTCIDYGIEKKAGLIMMMTETESNSWFMGTAAQQLVNHSPIPVMSIHSRDLYLAGESGY